MESLKAIQKDAGKHFLPLRGTVRGESLDHTAKALQIQKDGNKPEDWLNYTRFIKNSVDFPDPVDRHNFLCGIYDLAIKTMPVPENKKNVALAVLLIEYANLKSTYSPDDAQALFSYARVNMKRLALVYIADAQFKLKQGYPRKCKKLFEKAQMFDVQPASLLQKAMKNFAEGKADLLSDEDLDLYIKSESGTGDKDRSGNCSSQENTGTGDWGFAGQSDRQPLSLLTKKPVFGHDVHGGDTGLDVEDMETNTAPVNMQTDSKVAQEPPAAPASCSKPPFRTYHSTPDIKNSAGSSRPKFLPRRVKRLDIPEMMTMEEDSEEEDSYFRDVKPLEQDNYNRTQALESMNQSQPGHTSGYVSSVSMTCHTKTCPILPASEEKERARPDIREETKPVPSPGLRPSSLAEEQLGMTRERVDHLSTHLPNSSQMRTCGVLEKKDKCLDIVPTLQVEPRSNLGSTLPPPTSRPQPQLHPHKQVMPSQPVFATPSQRGLPVIALQGTPTCMTQCTPNMKAVQELWVNERSYEIFSVVGRGGSSKVYHCLDYRNQKSVGIKCVDLSGADENIIQGYKNEITLLKRLQYSDKVIKMHDYEYKEEMSSLLIVMELADTDLATLFKNASKSKDITPCLMNYYWEAMLKAVKVLHQEGIIHSDLKPANFVLVKGKLKLIDFGIANAIQQDLTSVMRESQVGTLNYMSPEAIMDSCGGMSTDGSGRAQPRYKIGVKSDVWSLGCILYNMVYGRTPFQRITNAMMKYQAITNPSYNIEFRDISDTALLDVMKQCLIRDVKLRPSIDDLLVHPYLKKNKEPSPVPTPVQSLLDKIQAVANSPNSMRKIENMLEQLQGGKERVGSDLTK